LGIILIQNRFEYINFFVILLLFRRLKILPIDLCIKGYYRRLQIAKFDGNSNNSSRICGRYGSTPSLF